MNKYTIFKLEQLLKSWEKESADIKERYHRRKSPSLARSLAARLSALEVCIHELEQVVKRVRIPPTYPPNRQNLKKPHPLAKD